MPNNNHNKSTFFGLRKKILVVLSHGQKTINQLSTETGINWKTVSNHLIYLLGRGLVKEVLSTPYVRIFEITDLGKEYLNSKLKKLRSNGKFHSKRAPIHISIP